MTEIKVGDLVTINESAWHSDIRGTTRKVLDVGKVNVKVEGDAVYPHGIYLNKGSEVTLAAKPEPKFKAGDRVKVGEDAWTSRGKLATVLHGPDMDGDYFVKTDGSSIRVYIGGEDLTLAKPEPKFKEGDVVRFTTPLSGAGLGYFLGRDLEGQEGLVDGDIEFKENEGQYIYCVDGWYVPEDSLELVEEEPKFKVGDKVKVAEGATFKLGVSTYPSIAKAGKVYEVTAIDSDKDLELGLGVWASPEFATLVEAEPEVPTFKKDDKVRIAEGIVSGGGKRDMAGKVGTILRRWTLDARDEYLVVGDDWKGDRIIKARDMTLVEEVALELTPEWGDVVSASALVEARNARILDNEEVRAILATADTISAEAVNLLFAQGIVTLEEAQAFYASVLDN